MPYDLAIPLLSIYPKRIVIYIHQETYSNVYNIPFKTPKKKNTENTPNIHQKKPGYINLAYTHHVLIGSTEHE